MNTVEITDTIYNLHPNVNLSVDYFCVQGIVFLHSISSGYNFRTVEYLREFKVNFNKKEVLNGLKDALICIMRGS